MPIFLLKSLLSILLLVLTFFSFLTMLEVFGRESRFDVERLKRLHRFNGRIYLILYILIAYFCVDFIVKTKAEPSPRAAFHGVFALSVITLLFLKFTFVRFYKKFYNWAKTLGILVGLLTIGMIGTSAGYYLLITKFGKDIPVKKVEEKEIQKVVLKTDSESIAKGKELYESKCYFCHDAFSTKWEVGPGHKGILKNPLLPVSKKPATPENIANQLRHPYKDMPSFSYLSDEDVLNLIAYLNTL